MLSRSEFDAYSEDVKSQAQEAMRKVSEFAKRLDYGSTAESRALARKMLQDYAYDCITLYGDNAGTIAAQYYDDIAKAAGADVPDAVIAAYPPREQVDANVAYATRSIWGKNDNGELLPVESSIADAASQSVYGHVSRMANYTMMDNAKRDGARYARVPTGKHTCAFCMLMASRGFVYHSEQSALYRSYMRKYHDDCDCRAVSVFDDEGLEGYDPDGDFGQYRAATEALPDKATRAEFNALTKQEQDAYGKEARRGGDGYNNYRLHRIAAQMREMYGMK